MKTKKYWTLITLIISCVLFFFLMDNVDSAETEFPEYSTTVELVITAKDMVKNNVYSFISRELRSLGDVKVVKDNGDWVIHIISLENKMEDRHFGFALSIAILRSFRLSDYAPKQIFGDRINEKDYKLLEGLTNNLYWFEDFWARTGGEKDLKGSCQDVVADFDALHLKAERERHQKLKNRIQKLRKNVGKK